MEPRPDELDAAEGGAPIAALRVGCGGIAPLIAVPSHSTAQCDAMADDEDDQDDAPIEYEMAYHQGSGRYEHFSFLAMRYDAATGFRSTHGESFIGEVVPDPVTGLRYTVHTMLPGWFTGLWRSPADRVYVTESWGRIYAYDKPNGEGVTITKLDGALFGIWGLDDGHVLAWGEHGTTPVMYRWDGRAWAPVASPPYRVYAVHGLAPDHLWACGPRGAASHWDGTRWRTVPTASDEILVSVFAAGADEIYGCGNHGTLFQGSRDGWTRVGAIPGALPGDVTAVAMWNGALLVAANRLGLWRRSAAGELECIKPKVDCVSLDVRDGVVAACQRKLVITNGQRWRGTGTDFILTMRGDKPIGGPYP
jgi:hypothetical protein